MSVARPGKARARGRISEGGRHRGMDRSTVVVWWVSDDVDAPVSQCIVGQWQLGGTKSRLEVVEELIIELLLLLRVDSPLNDVFLFRAWSQHELARVLSGTIAYIQKCAVSHHGTDPTFRYPKTSLRPNPSQVQGQRLSLQSPSASTYLNFRSPQPPIPSHAHH